MALKEKNRIIKAISPKMLREIVLLIRVDVSYKFTVRV